MASRKSEVWEIVNREKKRRKKVNENMREWKEHFMRLLGGVEARVIMGEEGGERLRDE